MIKIKKIEKKQFQEIKNRKDFKDLLKKKIK